VHGIVELGRVVVRRYAELNGRLSAAAITLYGFLALFTLCVLAVAVVGNFATGNDDVAHDIVSWLGLHGDAATAVTDAVNAAAHSAKVASVVGIVSLVWVGSSFAVAVASAYDLAWGVPPRASRARLVGLGWLVGSALLLAAGSFVTAGLGTLPILVAPLLLLGSLVLNTVLWLWTSWILPNRLRPPWRKLLPGSIVGAVGLEALKIAGAFVVPMMVERSSAIYGTIGTVFALIAWLWLVGRLVVLVTIVETLERAEVMAADG
jgi:YihY family inner membrane protein